MTTDTSTDCYKKGINLDAVYKTNTVVDADINSQLFNGNNEIKLKKMGFVNKYILDWYNPLTGQQLQTTTKWSDAFGKLRLDFPTLSNAYNTVVGNIPFMLAYKIRRQNEPSFIIPNDNPPQQELLTKMMETFSNVDTLYSKTKVVERANDKLVKYENSVLINLAPNPTDGVCTVLFSGELSNATLTLLNSTGKTMQTHNMVNNKKVLNLANEPLGVYLVIIQTSTGIYTQKLIKQ